MRRVDSALLTGVGVLSVHQISYAIAASLSVDSTVGHGHLAALWTLAGLAAVAALVTSVTKSLRARRHVPLPVGPLTAMLLVIYTGMEGVERRIDGAPLTSLFSEPVFWIGILSAPLVALALRGMLRTAADLAHAVHAARRGGRSTWAPAPSATWPATSVDVLPLALRVSVATRRGPPVR